jgi:hypothetical protein
VYPAVPLHGKHHNETDQQTNAGKRGSTSKRSAKIGLRLARQYRLPQHLPQTAFKRHLTQ